MDNNETNFKLIIDTSDEDILNNVSESLDENRSQREHHHRSHHEHSGSHHSRHHRRSKRSSRKSKKKNKKRVSAKQGWTIVIIACVLFLAFVVGVIILDSKKAEFNGGSTIDQTNDILVVEIDNAEGSLVNNAVKKYLLTDLLNPLNSDVLISSFSEDGERFDAQVPIRMEMSVKEGNASLYKVEVAKDSTFTDAETFYVEPTVGFYEFEHLYSNTTYYYRITVYTGNGVDSVEGQFTTADTPRILSIDGLSNVRDIGNWKTESGQRIKQGLLIRGTEMDAAVESGYHLTDVGLVDMIEVFGIKTDIDLRAQTTTSKDALGSRVDHRYYDMAMYDGIFTDEGKEKVRMVFADLSNPDNYPVYLHCTYGRDRTGTICYLLEALLGVSRGDCLKDYGLSNSLIEHIQLVENGLKEYKGDTLKEQAEAYLLSCGISEYQIESIRKIFLEE